MQYLNKSGFSYANYERVQPRRKDALIFSFIYGLDTLFSEDTEGDWLKLNRTYISLSKKNGCSTKIEVSARFKADYNGINLSAYKDMSGRVQAKRNTERLLKHLLKSNFGDIIKLLETNTTISDAFVEYENGSWYATVLLNLPDCLNEVCEENNSFYKRFRSVYSIG